MTNRERVNAILHYETFDKIPVVSFGFWTETLRKWAQEGHISQDLVADRPMDDHEYDFINPLLGFDFNWNSMEGVFQYLIHPLFEETILETYPNGKQKMRNKEGAIVLNKPGIVSIQAELGHTLTDRESWEKEYLPRLSYGVEAVCQEKFLELSKENDTRENPLGLFCGSLFGRLRNWLGLENFTYLTYDDPDLFEEIIHTIGSLLYRQIEYILSLGVPFDYGHFWEDICGNDGPLAQPALLKELAGPHYRKITDLLQRHGIDIVTVDCDGCIDHMVPIWLENGVNTMFPIEVGYWEANIGNWRNLYGKTIRGIGGMNKKVFAQDYRAIDAEIERLKPLIALGGYIPCPDHRIPPDAIWENVQYYCEKMHQLAI